MEIILFSLISLTVTTLVLGFLYSINNRKLLIKKRLTSYTCEPEKNALSPELNRPLKDRVLIPVFQHFNVVAGNIISGEKKQVYEKRLQAAGNPYGLNAQSFIVLKYSFLLLALLLGVLLRNGWYFFLLLITGIIAPDLFLKSNEKKRKAMILKSLPDVLDLLSVSVEAGLGFDSALQKVIEKSNGPLTAEFEKALQEINIGKPRREALRDMAERVNVNDVTIFLGSVIQADQLGVSIGNVLRLQSRQVRVNRRMRAEESAQKAPIKILIPLVLFIFPTILIVLLGPAFIQLMDTL
ncbi:MAG: type II secretion system F family protein [Syntrophomonadaceae bacterium]|nr:type II secretion system F family protein [Syntrophomonadaceae bacterium]